jgi:hypothetical protein
MAEMRRACGGPLDDGDALLALARLALGGPGDDGRSSYQVSLTVCEQCRKGWQHGRGELIEVSDEVVEMAECDAQHIGHVDEGVHVGANRAKQTIPPSVRRKVVARDHQRCRAPGCRCATFVDVHHRKPRSEGGTHTPDNLITLCSAHHTALHRGTLIIEGTPENPRFLHADGTPYGGAVSPTAADAFAKAFQGLKNLGYREATVRAALAKIRVSADANLEKILREALQILH